MTGNRKVFIDTVDFYSFTEGDDINIIVLNPMLYAKSHDGTTLGLQVLSLQGSEQEEVVFASFDATANEGKYTVDPDTNSLWLGVDASVITTQALALDYIQGFLLVYQMIDLQYASSESLYTMKSYLSDGTFVSNTLQSTFDVLEAKMDALDQNQNINTGGYNQHVLIRSIEAT